MLIFLVYLSPTLDGKIQTLTRIISNTMLLRSLISGSISVDYPDLITATLDQFYSIFDAHFTGIYFNSFFTFLFYFLFPLFIYWYHIFLSFLLLFLNLLLFSFQLCTYFSLEEEDFPQIKTIQTELANIRQKIEFFSTLSPTSPEVLDYSYSIVTSMTSIEKLVESLSQSVTDESLIFALNSFIESVKHFSIDFQLGTLAYIWDIRILGIFFIPFVLLSIYLTFFIPSF